MISRRPIPAAVKLMHWTVVLLIIALFGIAWSIDSFETGPVKTGLIDLHRSIGLVVFVLALIRPVLRFALGGVRFTHIAKTLYSVRTHAGREVNVHSSSNWGKLLDESRSLVRRARAEGGKR